MLYGGASGISPAGSRQFVQGNAGGGVESGDRFGAALAAGDFDQSGHADLAAGAPDEDAGSIGNAGVVNVLHGSFSGIGVTGNRQFVQGNAGGGVESGDRFGAVLATGDFNNSGHADLAAAAPDEDAGSIGDIGVVNLLYGGASGIGTTGNARFVQANAAGSVEGADRFGAALTAGDYNRSGHVDLAAGAPDEDVGSISDAVASPFTSSMAASPASMQQETAIDPQGSTGRDPVESGDRFGAAMR